MGFQCWAPCGRFLVALAEQPGRSGSVTRTTSPSLSVLACTMEEPESLTPTAVGAVSQYGRGQSGTAALRPALLWGLAVRLVGPPGWEAGFGDREQILPLSF